jgi:hypothetical protein
MRALLDRIGSCTQQPSTLGVNQKEPVRFFLEVSNTEQAIIGRLESVSLHSGMLDHLKTRHAKT